jgi:hypothetical protein
MKATCTRCDKAFEADSETGAVNTRTGEDHQGCAGRNPAGELIFYGRDGKNWPRSETKEYEMQVGAPGFFGLCETCIDRKAKAMGRAMEYQSDVPPDWFDPTYAGERWGDDY